MKRAHKAHKQIEHILLYQKTIQANIPNTLKQQILAGLCRAFKNKTLEPRARTFGGAFVWSNTPEGHAFWEIINSLVN